MIIHSIYNKGNNGFFAKFLNAIHAIDYYNSKGEGVYIDWSKIPYYYDKDTGENVWQYFFEQPYISEAFEKNTIAHEHLGRFGYNSCAKKEEMIKIQQIVKMHIKLKEETNNKIESFYNKYLLGKKILGVHKRGGAMYSNAPSSYRKWTGHFDNELSCTTYFDHIKKHEPDFDCIFLATDEINILNCFKKEYKDKLLFYEGVIRSSIKEEVYLQNNNSFKLGEDVLIDCLLLSKCSKIVCTKSNVSISAFGFSDLLYEDITFLDIDNKIVR